MKERPILFNAEMVRAILDGRKTQTRRVVRGQPFEIYSSEYAKNSMELAIALGDGPFTYPFGVVGDRLWVRETFGFISFDKGDNPCTDVVYKADEDDEAGDLDGAKWHPSIHMSRWASRITLEITRVRVERLQDISQRDAIAEGVQKTNDGFGYHIKNNDFYAGEPVETFARFWGSIYGAGSWESNPWVWVIEFKKLEEGK